MLKDPFIFAAVVLAAVVGIIAIGSLASNPAEAGQGVSVPTFVVSQFRQDVKIYRNERDIQANERDINRNERAIRRNDRVDRRQSHQIRRNAVTNYRQQRAINTNEENIADLQDGQARLGLDLSVLGAEFKKADQASRERDAAILAIDKPLLMMGQTSGFELGLARAGGETGIGLSGVHRFNLDVYGTLGFAAAGSTVVTRAGVGIGW